MTPQISVVMTNYNARRTIGKCIESILNQSKLKPLEVVIVDAESTDGSLDIIRKYEDRGVKLIVEKGISTSAGEAKAQQLARGEFVANTNSDIYVPKDWLERSYSWWLKGYSIVGGVRINAGDIYNFAWTAYPGKEPWEEERPELGLSASSLFTSKEIMIRLLPPHSHFESRDVELAFAAKKHGLKFIIDPKICVIHDNPMHCAWNTFRKSAAYANRHVLITKNQYGKVEVGGRSAIGFSFRHIVPDYLLIDAVKTYYHYKPMMKEFEFEVSLPKFLALRGLFKLGQITGLLNGFIIGEKHKTDFEPIGHYPYAK